MPENMYIVISLHSIFRAAARQQIEIAKTVTSMLILVVTLVTRNDFMIWFQILAIAFILLYLIIAKIHFRVIIL